METILFITDFLDGAPHSRFNFFLSAGRPCAIFIHAFAANFARKDYKLGGGQRFTGDARFGVF